MSKGYLEDRENVILTALREILREKKNCCFNDLYRKLQESHKTSMARRILKETLDCLVESQLIQMVKRRRGQKNLYMLTEALTKSEEKARSLETMWDDLFHRLAHLENLVKGGKLAYHHAGLLLVQLVFEAVPLLPMTLEPSFPLELNERLLGFSADMFRSYWIEIIRIGHEHPEIRDGFRKGCEWLRSYVKPVTDEIEEALGK